MKNKIIYELLKYLMMFLWKKFYNIYYYFEIIKIKYYLLFYFVFNKKKVKIGLYDIRCVIVYVFGKRNYWWNISSFVGDFVWIMIFLCVY